MESCVLNMACKLAKSRGKVYTKDLGQYLQTEYKS